jgi:hypothetical protein
MDTNYEAEKAVVVCEDSRPSLTISLKRERDRLAEKLKALDNSIALIESQPETQKLLDALSELGKLRY